MIAVGHATYLSRWKLYIWQEFSTNFLQTRIEFARSFSIGIVTVNWGNP
jgi:hypothetical protein